MSTVARHRVAPPLTKRPRAQRGSLRREVAAPVGQIAPPVGARWDGRPGDVLWIRDRRQQSQCSGSRAARRSLRAAAPAEVAQREAARGCSYGCPRARAARGERAARPCAVGTSRAPSRWETGGSSWAKQPRITRGNRRFDLASVRDGGSSRADDVFPVRLALLNPGAELRPASHRNQRLPIDVPALPTPRRLGRSGRSDAFRRSPTSQRQQHTLRTGKC